MPAFAGMTKEELHRASLVIARLDRAIQSPPSFVIATGTLYWMPAFAGMTKEELHRASLVIARLDRAIQSPPSFVIATGALYWMPAFAGMTTCAHGGQRPVAQT